MAPARSPSRVMPMEAICRERVDSATMVPRRPTALVARTSGPRSSTIPSARRSSTSAEIVTRVRPVRRASCAREQGP